MEEDSPCDYSALVSSAAGTERMLTVQFGQCGNQLGHELFDKISDDIESQNTGVSYGDNYNYIESSCERWFSGITKNGERIARSILIDTERRVIEEITRESREKASWRYSKKNAIISDGGAGGGGSGNNWAHGYCTKAGELTNDVLESVRSECESADRVDGFLTLLGSAGGTGSGVGSRMLEIFRRDYPTKSIIAGLVLPFASGEVGTQNYNGLLTLAKLTDHADAIIIMENDRLFRVCEINRKLVEGKQVASLRDMNEVACDKLMAIFQPIKGTRNGANFFVNKMASHPSYKITRIECNSPPLRSGQNLVEASSARASFRREQTPEYSIEWQIQMRQLKRTLRIVDGKTRSNFKVSAREQKQPYSESNNEVYRRSVSNILITRGHSSINGDDRINLQEFIDDRLYPSWTQMAKDQRFTNLSEKRRFFEREKFAALVTNNSQICGTLNGLVNGAWTCYTNGAFLHLYKQFGLEDDDFLRAFGKVENVVKVYDQLDSDESL